MLSSVVVISKNNVIGCENGLVFNIPEDLKRFKEITSGGSGIMIMGRKTFDSLPGILPNRHHIILTNNKDYTVPNNNGKVEVVTDINEIIEKYSKCEEEVFIIGGGQIYEKLMPYTKKLYITYVDKEAKGDTFFPKIQEDLYNEVYKSEDIYTKNEDCNYYHVDLLKK